LAAHLRHQKLTAIRAFIRKKQAGDRIGSFRKLLPKLVSWKPLSPNSSSASSINVSAATPRTTRAAPVEGNLKAGGRVAKESKRSLRKVGKASCKSL